MAYAAARFAYALIRAKNGASVKECTFIKNQDPNVELGYFAMPCVLGPRGVEEPKPIVGELDDFEKQLLKKALVELKANIEKGEKWARAELAKPKYN
jgi:malate/lactate dehydrogenase